VSSEANEKLILALPKGRIFKEAAPLFARAGIEPESAFADPDARQLRFTTNHDDLDIIRVRSFDVATFVAFGAAHLGIAGADVLMEFDYPEIYAPIDLGIGKCRLAVAEPVEMAGSATEVAPMSSPRRSAWRTADARSISSPKLPPFQTGPTAWITHFAGSLPARVTTACPTAQVPIRSHSSWMVGPPFCRIAPATPEPS